MLRFVREILWVFGATRSVFAWIYFFGYISIFIAVFAINMEVDNEDIILEYLEQEGDPMGENPLQEAPAETEGAIPEGDGQGAVLPQEGEPATGVMTRHRSAIVASEAALQLASQAMKKKQDEPPKGGANPGVRSSLPQPPTKKEGGRGTTNKSVQRGGHNGVTRGYHHSPAGSDIERGYESRESQGTRRKKIEITTIGRIRLFFSHIRLLVVYD